MTPSEAWTSGAMVATASDAAAFLDGLFGGALLPPESLAWMTSRPSGSTSIAAGDSV